MPTFTFTSPEGKDYTIDGPDGATQEQAFGILQQSIQSQKQGITGDFGAAEENTVGRAIGENVRGGITAAGDLIASAPGMLAAAIPSAIEGVTSGPEAGNKMFGQISEALNPLSQQFALGHPLPGTQALEADRQTGAYQNLNKPFEMIGQGYGNIGAAVASAAGASDEQAAKAAAGTQLALNVGMGLAGGLEGAIKVKEAAKIAADRAKQVELENAATDVINQAAAKDKAIQDYHQAYQDLDSQMLKYPKDYQAPQYGLGGKVARVPDQVGKPKTGITQESFNADLQKAAEDSAAWEAAQAQKATAPIEYTPNAPEMAPTTPDIYQIERQRGAGSTLEQGGTAVESRPTGQRTISQLGLEPIATDRGVSFPYKDTLEYPQTKPRLYGPEGEAVPVEAPAKIGLRDSFNGDLYNAQQTGKSIREQLQTIANGPHEDLAGLASHLLKQGDLLDPEFGLKMKVHQTPTVLTRHGKVAEAMYDPTTDVIHMASKAHGDAGTLIHEIGHARTQAVMHGVRQGVSKYQWAKPYVTRLENLYNVAKRELAGQTHYGLESLDEFVSEGWGNREFMDSLRQIKSPYGGTVASKFIDTVRKILKLPTEYKSVLEDLLHTSEEMASRTEDLQRRGYFRYDAREELKDLMQKERKGLSFGEFVQGMERQGHTASTEVMRGLYEKMMQDTKPPKPNTGNSVAPKVDAVAKVPGLERLKQELVDNRPREEVVAQTLQVPDMSLPDAKIYGNVAPPTFAAKLNPYTRWVSSQIHRIKDMMDLRANEKLSGASRKNPTPGSYNYLWTKLKPESRVSVNDLGQHLNNEGTWLGREGIQAKARELLGRTLTPDELQSYLDRLRINSEVLKDINKTIVAEGREPIHDLPHYWSPAEFEGPFLTFFKNPGEHEAVLVKSSYLRPNVKKLQKAFPEYEVTFTEKGLRNTMDFQQFEQALRSLGKSQRDPAARALSEALRRRGFMRHGVKRSGTKGALGTEGGFKGMRKYEETSEKYIRNSYDYIGNRQLDDLYKKTTDDEALKQRPNAREFSLEMLDTARGGGWAWADQAGSAIAKGLGLAGRIATFDKVGLPERFLNDLGKLGNRMATATLLGFGNMTYLMANIVQGEFFAPVKMLALATEHGNKNIVMAPITVLKAWSRAHANLMNPYHPDIVHLDKIGALDSTFRYDYSSYATSVAHSRLSRVVDHVSGRSMMAFVERNAVRRPASLMFLEMIRELGIDKTLPKGDEYFMAKRLTDQYMVSMKWYEKAQMFSRTGILGTFTGALQSFTATWAGMFTEYTRLATEGVWKNPANALPLAAFLGVTFMSAGLMGLPLVQELDSIVGLVNKYMHTNYPSATELIFKATKNRKMRYGVFSDMTGMNVGASMAAPSATGTAAPGAQYLGKLTDLAGTALGATGMFGELNKPTQTDWRDALAGVAPRFTPFPGGVGSKGWIEQQFTPPGMPYARQSGSAGPVTRTPEDWRARRFGTHSIAETEQQTNAYIGQEHAQQRGAMLKEAMDQASDHILFGKDPEKELNVLIPILVKQGYTGDEIKSSLINSIKSKVIDSQTRAIGQAHSSGQRNLLLLMQQLGQSQ